MESVKVKEQNASFALFLSVFASTIEYILVFYKIGYVSKDETVGEYSMPHVMKSVREVEQYSLSQKQEYYSFLRNVCNGLKTRSFTCDKIIVLLAPMLRNFEIEIRGIENLPEHNLLFVANHSNSHDYFVTKEVFGKMQRNVTPMGAWDGLNALARFVFKAGDVTFIDRANKKSSENGIMDFCKKILKDGKDGIIFGEGTWNLHPTLPMLKVKAGAVQISLITEKPIVPVIFEYIEVPNVCRRERDLYTKCVVQFGKPIFTTIADSIFEQTDKVMHVMTSIRKSLWNEFGIARSDVSEINKDVYLNHLYLKKNKAFGFKYNSEWESQFLIDKENEYCINENGNFVPGVLDRSFYD